MTQNDLIDKSKGSAFSSVLMMAMLPKMWNEHTFENANVQKFIKSTDAHFDVIVAEDFLNEAIYMFAYKHKAPLITICKSNAW